MLSVDDARMVVLEHARPLAPQVAALTPSLLGHILAEGVASDIDSPPFDKAMMDGYAVRAADCTGDVVLRVIEEIAAGMVPTQTLTPGTASRIMTGAPIPPGADAVVKIEATAAHPDGVRIFTSASVDSNRLRRGQEMANGEIVLDIGTLLRPAEFGLLASMGRTTVSVYPAPRVAILSTGSELVEADQTPRGGQIRNSNGPMLLMQTVRAGGEPHYLGIASDDPESLRALLRQGLEYDVLLVSGGVSMGDYDLVPKMLEELGVTAHFHKIKLKPGKPLLFGTRGDTLVFGLPGNPVSSFVCFELIVRAALEKLRGILTPGPRRWMTPLTANFAHTTDRETYYPANLDPAQGVRPVAWFGSADLRGITRANAFIVVPPGEHAFAAGQFVWVMPFDLAGNS